MSNAEYTVQCDFCHRDLNALDRHTWQTLEGYGRRGMSGGGSDVALREYTNKGWAHDHYIRRAQEGLPALQETLV